MLGGTAGYAHSTDISEAALKRAAETARMAARAGGGVLAEPPQGTNRRLYEAADPVGDAAVGAKVAMLAEIDAYLRGRDPRVVQVTATLAGSVQEVEILRPEGGRVTDHRPLARLNVSVIVADNRGAAGGRAGRAAAAAATASRR